MKEGRGPTYDIDRLIDGITEANRYGEVDWGTDTGREAMIGSPDY